MLSAAWAGKDSFFRRSFEVRNIPIPDGAESITLETDQFYAPADRSRPWRQSTDQRHLGLRIYSCALR